MNNTTKITALLSVLSLMAAGCQKESVTDYVPGTSFSETCTVYTVQYVVDGVLHHATLHGKSERTDFFRQLFAIAKKGHEVVFYDGSKTEKYAVTKEVIHYSTTDEDDALAWADKMYDNGYKVRISFDEEKKVFNCVAWK